MESAVDHPLYGKITPLLGFFPKTLVIEASCAIIFSTYDVGIPDNVRP